MTSVDRQAETGLAALQARIRRDLDYLGRPPANWVDSHGAGEQATVHVVIVGGGM
jgi:hypothetical protein